MDFFGFFLQMMSFFVSSFEIPPKKSNRNFWNFWNLKVELELLEHIFASGYPLGKATHDCDGKCIEYIEDFKLQFSLSTNAS